MKIDQKKLKIEIEKVEKKALSEAKKIGKQIGKIEKGAKRFIKNNPKKSIVAAAGVGAIIGAGVKAVLSGKKKVVKTKGKKKKR